jgi:hypothetical protein
MAPTISADAVDARVEADIPVIDRIKSDLKRLVENHKKRSTLPVQIQYRRFVEATESSLDRLDSYHLNRLSDFINAQLAPKVTVGLLVPLHASNAFIIGYELARMCGIEYFSSLGPELVDLTEADFSTYKSVLSNLVVLLPHGDLDLVRAVGQSKDELGDKTRVGFILSDDVEDITIGRLLTRSMEHVFLDDQTSRLEISPLQAPLNPKVNWNRHGQLDFLWLRRWSPDYDHSSEDPDGQRKTCWTLFHLMGIDEENRWQKRTDILPKLEFLDKANSEALMMRFGLDASASPEEQFEVTLDYRPDRLVVCKHPPLEECPICYNALYQGIHKAGCCRKRFHSACIQQWLKSGRNKKCPLCRA